MITEVIIWLLSAPPHVSCSSYRAASWPSLHTLMVYIVVIDPSVSSAKKYALVVRVCHQYQQTHLYCVYWKKDAFFHLRIAGPEEEPAVLPLLHCTASLLETVVVVAAALASSSYLKL